MPGCESFRRAAASFRWKTACCCFWRVRSWWRGNLPARIAAPGAGARRGHGTARHRRLRVRVLLFDETPDTVREKNYRNLKNITPGYFGYSMLRNSVHSEFYEDLLKLGIEMDFPIEGLHTETGPGVLEAALMHSDALSAADRAALFKTYTKILAQRNGWMATFMAKWSPDWPGQIRPYPYLAGRSRRQGGVPRGRA
jgi:hypothetical protein